MTRLCVLGPSGRMGKTVISMAVADPNITVVSAVDHAKSSLLGTEVAPGVTVISDLSAGLKEADVYIDFSTPAATTLAAQTALAAGTAAVIGTTGLDESAELAIAELATKSPVLVAANFSVGVNLMLILAEQAARALGPDYDLEVAEIHHRRKRDAPSGTALAVADALAKGRGISREQNQCLSREGEVGQRPENEIGIVALRGGDVVGEHTAYFIHEQDRIEITHRAASREIFASGSIRAARWISAKPAGHYAMRDVLGFG